MIGKLKNIKCTTKKKVDHIITMTKWAYISNVVQLARRGGRGAQLPKVPSLVWIGASHRGQSHSLESQCNEIT